MPFSEEAWKEESRKKCSAGMPLFLIEARKSEKNIQAAWQPYHIRPRRQLI